MLCTYNLYDVYTCQHSSQQQVFTCRLRRPVLFDNDVRSGFEIYNSHDGLSVRLIKKRSKIGLVYSESDNGDVHIINALFIYIYIFSRGRQSGAEIYCCEDGHAGVKIEKSLRRALLQHCGVDDGPRLKTLLHRRARVVIVETAKFKCNKLGIALRRNTYYYICSCR